MTIDNDPLGLLKAENASRQLRVLQSIAIKQAQARELSPDAPTHTYRYDEHGRFVEVTETDGEGPLTPAA